MKEVRIMLRGKKANGTRNLVATHFTGQKFSAQANQTFRGRLEVKNWTYFTMFADKGVGAVVQFRVTDEKTWAEFLMQMKIMGIALNAEVVVMPNGIHTPKQLTECGGVLRIKTSLIPPAWVGQVRIWLQVAEQHVDDYAGAILHYTNKCAKLGVPAKAAA